MASICTQNFKSKFASLKIRVRSAHLFPGLPMGFTRVNPGWALSLILKKWVLSGSSLFLMFTFVYFTVI